MEKQVAYDLYVFCYWIEMERLRNRSYTETHPRKNLCKYKLYLLYKVQFTLVRECIAYPYMDFQKSMDINMAIHYFSMPIFNYPYKCGYPHWYPNRDIHKDILQWISVNNKISMNGYQSSIIHDFMDIHLDIIGFLWISMHWLAMDSQSRVNGWNKDYLIWISKVLVVSIMRKILPLTV